MGLPLVDGIFPALVLAGALGSITGIFEVGLLVFGGSATLAVVLAEMEGTRREQVLSVLSVGAVIVAVAAAEAALAPTIERLIDLDTFERFAALVILAIAAKTASSTLGEYLPSPGTIVGLGLLASLDPAGFELVFNPNAEQITAAAAAAAVGTSFALVAAVAGPTLRRLVDIDRFRFGSAVALGILPLTMLGIVKTQAPLALAVLGVTCLLSLDPTDASIDGASESVEGGEPAGTSVEPAESVDAVPTAVADDDARAPVSSVFADPEARGASAATDGGANSIDDDRTSGRERVRDPERAPWL